MSPSNHVTTQVVMPTLLAVGCSPDLLAWCKRAGTASGLVIKTCSTDEVSRVTGSLRPLVIAVPAGVYAFHAIELDAVACAAGAMLVQLDPAASEPEVKTAVERALREQLGRRDWIADAGQYSIIRGGAVDVPLAPKSRRPRVQRSRVQRRADPDATGAVKSERAPRAKPQSARR